MTDRIKGLTVTLEEDIRDDDCEIIISAINMIKGVISVSTHVTEMDHHMAKEQLKHELKGKIYDLVKNL